MIDKGSSMRGMVALGLTLVVTSLLGLATDAQQAAGPRRYVLAAGRRLPNAPGIPSSFIDVGPQGADWSDGDGRTWTAIEGPGFHTFGFAPRGGVGWAAGSNGRVARWNWNGRTRTRILSMTKG
jgi:hypothetical protein